jgi:hypothetical protein
MKAQSLEQQIESLTPMEPGEVILGEWWAVIRPTSISDKLILTNHRLMGFRTKGILHPALASLIPNWMFQLGEIGPPILRLSGRHYVIFIQANEVQILMEDPDLVAHEIEKARRDRLSSLRS